MPWIDSLPHQIPFRAASAIVRRGDDSLAGTFLCTANDETTPEVMLTEAMAQFAGAVALRSAGLLAAIDRCSISVPILPGDRVEIEAVLEATFGTLRRFAVEARRDGVEVGRGRFTLMEAADRVEESRVTRTEGE